MVKKVVSLTGVFNKVRDKVAERTIASVGIEVRLNFKRDRRMFPDAVLPKNRFALAPLLLLDSE
jgi:hypothetical protein